MDSFLSEHTEDTFSATCHSRMDIVGPSGGPTLQLVSPGPCHTLSRSPSAGTGFPGWPEQRPAGLRCSETGPGTQAGAIPGDQEHRSGVCGRAFPALSPKFISPGEGPVRRPHEG